MYTYHSPPIFILYFRCSYFICASANFLLFITFSTLCTMLTKRVPNSFVYLLLCISVCVCVCEFCFIPARLSRTKFSSNKTQSTKRHNEKLTTVSINGSVCQIEFVSTLLQFAIFVYCIRQFLCFFCKCANTAICSVMMINVNVSTK